MGLMDEPGTMGRRLRELAVTNEGGLRLIIGALLEPTTQMVDAGWDAREAHGLIVAGTPAVTYRAMLQAALLDIIEDAKQLQHADTDGLAKQHAALHDYLHRAGIEKETW
jgi:hypothetical protein